MNRTRPIPFPFTTAPTACRRQPSLFSHEETTKPTARTDSAQARRVCADCPIAEACLKWALTHPADSRVGIWAATTAHQRAQLRRRLAARLGPDWADVIAQHGIDRIAPIS